MASPTRHPTIKRTLAHVWGEAIQARRAKLGLTQQELASRCDITQQALSLFERGERIPLDRMKIVLARELLLPVQDLFKWPPASEIKDLAS